ncbi:heterogeneous nuclear ribonucleoprotein A1-like 2 [Macrotis lagotis]|uniref:heterogeneous nuclear ribonucleoprotein A1-like 2 n=1 Tax=Macrotis lagotis TaxID=92651 RepID=UPI003D697B64
MEAGGGLGSSTMESESGASSSVLEHVQLTKLFVGGLNPSTTSESLRQHFKAFGRLKKSVVVMNEYTRCSRGFGFLTYNSMSEADKAMAASPHLVDGNRVELKRAVAPEEKSNPWAHARVKKVFVGGLKDFLSESDLVQHFSQFGMVEKAEILINKQTGMKRGFGFVHFFDRDTADKASVVRFHCIQGLFVEVKKALPKKELDRWNTSGLEQNPTRRPTGRTCSDSDTKFVKGLIPTLTWIPTPKPASIPSPNSGCSPKFKPAQGPNPKPVKGHDPNPTGKTLTPNAKTATNPASKPAPMPSSESRSQNYSPRHESNPNSGLHPKHDPSLKQSLKLKFGAGSNPNQGLGQGTQISMTEPCNSCSDFS